MTAQARLEPAQELRLMVRIPGAAAKTIVCWMCNKTKEAHGWARAGDRQGLVCRSCVKREFFPGAD